MSDMTIGAVAKAAGVNVETIRFYEQLGLVIQPPKPMGSFRRYPQETVLRLGFIKRAQQLGFSLEEIKSLLALEEARSCRQTHDLAVKKLQVVETRLADLGRMRRTLKQLIAQCESGKGKLACPIISTLSHPAEVGISEPVSHVRARRPSARARQ
jgi:MerR family transcriptional regulator, mercuric resistance operon regulatory protein